MASERDDFKKILELDSELNKIQDVDILLDRILLEARKIVHADAGSIYVREQAEDESGGMADKLVIKYAHNDTTQRELPPGQKMIYSVFSVPINEKTISGYAAYTKKSVNVPDMYHIPEGSSYSFNPSFDKMSGYKTTSTLTFPLLDGEGTVLGVIQIINKLDDSGNAVPFTAEDELLVTHFATNAMVALNRAYDNREMILRMNKMAELRDPKETGTHVNRVAGYAVEIYDCWALHQGIPKDEMEKFRDDLKVAAMLHDVGKVAISDMILKKPARFTPEEYQVMKHHTVYGASIFNHIRSRTDQLARDIALTHHENWDGSGYPGWVDPMTEKPIKAGADGKPLGRVGEEIPLAGRIVAIADVYDALCSKRVYKDPWTEEQVLDEIRKMSGTKFEPELVDCFFEILPNIKQINSLYPEAKEAH